MVTAIFEGISAGTFVYIATMEVIVVEFAYERLKHQKIMPFMVAIGFVSCIWFLENLTGG